MKTEKKEEKKKESIFLKYGLKKTSLWQWRDWEKFHLNRVKIKYKFVKYVSYLTKILFFRNIKEIISTGTNGEFMSILSEWTG